MRCPIILPQKLRVTGLIIAAADKKCSHQFGSSYVLSQLADKYWLFRGIKKYRSECKGCRLRHAKPTQLMGQLPAPSVQYGQIAFSNVGVDHAGSFFTKQGRGKTKEKRYLCLFTCLESRACHLEMACSISTNDFLICFSRFLARRGTPHYVVSDNGSNFRATETELRQAVKSLEGGKITVMLSSQHIKWAFNPPHRPHHGGVFEIVIRSAKRAILEVCCTMCHALMRN